MQTESNGYLGARFLEEFTYVNEFCHEDQIIIQEFVNFMHLDMALAQLQAGDKTCYKYFMAPDGEKISDEDEEKITPNSRITHRQSVRLSEV